MRSQLPVLAFASLLSLSALAAGCSSSGDTVTRFAGTDAGGGGGNGGSGGSDGGALFDSGLPSGDGGTSGGGSVPQSCAESLQSKSYIGCEYWPTVTLNSELYTGFHFAIAAANPTNSPATVTVERGGAQVAQVNVAPGQLQTITLPWVSELKQVFPAAPGDPEPSSVLLQGGAYHVTSSVPITLYEFNALEYELTNAPPDCPNLSAGGCFSFTNDASLLLPTTALRGEYWVVNMPTHHYGVTDGLGGEQWVNAPGFVAITGTEAGTNVKVTARGNVKAGNGVPAIAAGQSKTFTLGAGDVLMLASGNLPDGPSTVGSLSCVNVQGNDFCPSPQAYDLTGSHIEADKPVSVIAGHDCTFVPYGSYACDHLEESLFPVDTLGQHLIVTAPRSVASLHQSSAPDNYFVRLLSAADNNVLTFEPASVSSPVTLNKGDWITLGPLTADFELKATDKVLVAEFKVGENFNTPAATEGDPDESVEIPVEQYRLSYTFLTPETYTDNLVNVVAPAGTVITLDGMPIDANEFTPIGASGYVVARHELPGGSHSIKGSANFGIVVYGYGSYTSYTYPGGLNLETIIITPH